MTTVTRPVHFAVKGKRKRIQREPERKDQVSLSLGRIPRISKLMALAIRYDQLLKDGIVQNQTELAELAQVTQPRMTQIMNLLHLAPEIQEKILFLERVRVGKDPITERDLRPIAQETDWHKQKVDWKAQNFAKSTIKNV